MCLKSDLIFRIITNLLRFSVMAVRQLGDLCRDSVGICEELNNPILVDNLQLILRRIEDASKKAEQSPYWRGQKPSLIAVSKTKPPTLIQ